MLVTLKIVLLPCITNGIQSKDKKKIPQDNLKLFL